MYPYDLDIPRTKQDDDGLASNLGEGITPRERMDEIAEELIPSKGARVKTPPVRPELLGSDHAGHMLSFDGAAKNETGPGALLISCGNSISGKS